MHALMLTRPSITWGPKHSNTAQEPSNTSQEHCHHNQWFSTGTCDSLGRRSEKNRVAHRRHSGGREAHEKLFSLLTALTGAGNADPPRDSRRKRPTTLDHRACRCEKVCRTSRRNPQLTHRTFSLSLYRSTSNCPYIQECDGLGDQPAEGVQPTHQRLIPSFCCWRTKKFRASRSGRSGTTPSGPASDPSQTTMCGPLTNGEIDDCHI